jgi:hypothetical protein
MTGRLSRIVPWTRDIAEWILIVIWSWTLVAGVLGVLALGDGVAKLLALVGFAFAVAATGWPRRSSPGFNRFQTFDCVVCVAAGMVLVTSSWLTSHDSPLRPAGTSPEAALEAAAYVVLGLGIAGLVRFGRALVMRREGSSVGEGIWFLLSSVLVTTGVVWLIVLSRH